MSISGVIPGLISVTISVSFRGASFSIPKSFASQTFWRTAMRSSMRGSLVSAWAGSDSKESGSNAREGCRRTVRKCLALFEHIRSSLTVFGSCSGAPCNSHERRGIYCRSLAFRKNILDCAQASGFRTFWNAKTYHSSGTFCFRNELKKKSVACSKMSERRTRYDMHHRHSEL